MYFVGIDTGVNTGIAVWDAAAQAFAFIDCMKIHEAMDVVRSYASQDKYGIAVRFEDARLRKWIPYTGSTKGEKGRAMGAGSVKRDCTIWEDFLNDLEIPYDAVAPKNNCTKLSADQFARITGWDQRTNEHARDAAMLVYLQGNKAR